MAKKGKKISVGAVVPPPFLHSSILFSTKTTAVPNFRAVTLLWAEIMHVLILVLKSGTSASPLLYYCINIIYPGILFFAFLFLSYVFQKNL